MVISLVCCPTLDPVRFCPYAQRTILTLLAKQVPFEVVNINLKNKPEWFLQQTWGTVSVVRLDAVSLSVSCYICMSFHS